jgi:hypothetical protein
MFAGALCILKAMTNRSFTGDYICSSIIVSGQYKYDVVGAYIAPSPGFQIKCCKACAGRLWMVRHQGRLKLTMKRRDETVLGMQRTIYISTAIVSVKVKTPEADFVNIYARPRGCEWPITESRHHKADQGEKKPWFVEQCHSLTEVRTPVNG